MCGRVFDWFHFRPHTPLRQFDPQTGGGGSNLGAITCYRNCGQTAADRAKLCFDRHWKVVGGLSIGANPKPLTGDLKTSPLSFGHAPVDGAAL